MYESPLGSDVIRNVTRDSVELDMKSSSFSILAMIFRQSGFIDQVVEFARGSDIEEKQVSCC